MKAPAACDDLNDGQRAALDLSRDLIVTAGAGAGKTQVLGLRYLALLEEGLARVHEIVAFTFTDKAAAEMRERVQGLLLARIDELRIAKEHTLLERLLKAQREFHLNRISTVHSFCRKLLSDFAWEAGLEPGAPLMDERVQQLTREAAVRNVLQDPELAPNLARLGSVVRLHPLMGTLNRLLRVRHVAGLALSRAAAAWQDPQAELQRRETAWQAQLQESMQGVHAELRRLDWGGIKSVKAGDKLREALLPLQAMLGDASRGQELASSLLTKALKARSFGNAGAAANWKGKADLQATRDLLCEAALQAESAAGVLKFPFSREHELRCAAALADLHTIFDRLLQVYSEECAGSLDFLDLELRAIELLRDQPDVRFETVPRIRYLLIDEFQDTNPTQAELFSLLIDGVSTPGRLFAVGDAKQSVYGFRGSDVAIFNGYLQSVPERNKASGAARKQVTPAFALTCQDTPERRSGIVRLTANYRTVAPVLEAGNDLFDRIFDADDYRPFDARPQRMDVGRLDAAADAPVQLHLLQRPKANAHADTDRRRDDEAEHVAQLVTALAQSGVAYSEIAILVRRRTRNSQYRDAFARHDIPLLVVGEGGLFETQEALDCVNLLRVLANPGDDVAVLGLMRSPFAAISDTYLTAMGLALGKKGTLLERLIRYQSDQPEAHAQALIETLRRLQARVGRDSPALLLTEAISEFGYGLAIGCGPDAEQRLANLARVIDLVRETQARFPTPATLVRELRTRIENEEDETQGVAEGEVDGVRLMTVHKSKGLQFGIVIVPDMGSNPRGSDTGIVRELPSDDGPLGLYLRRLDDDARGSYAPDFEARRAALDAAERGASEEKRTLYVAYTRAKDRVIMVGTVSDDFEGDTWAEQVLRGIGCSTWGDQPGAGVQVHWIDQIERATAAAHTPAIAAVRAALQAGALPLPAAVDTTLVEPIALPVAPAFFNRQATEFGSLVHAGVERMLRGLEMGVTDAQAATQAQRALDALNTLRPARQLLPEIDFLSVDGARRLDLLRVLDGDEYEIVDFKSDRADVPDLQAYARDAHGPQLQNYAGLLREYLAARGRPAKAVRMLVCFTAPEHLQPAQRLVEITD